MHKKLLKTGLGLGAATLGLSVVSSALPPNAVGSHGQTGLLNLSSALPYAGTIAGAGMTFGALNKLSKQVKKF